MRVNDIKCRHLRVEQILTHAGGTPTLGDLGVSESAVLDGVTAGTVTASKALVVDANKDIATLRNVTISGNIVHGSTTLAEADTAKIDGITNGTQAAGKAVVADSNVNTGISKVTELHIGATGAETQILATAAEINTAADQSGQVLTPGAGITAGVGTVFKTSIAKQGDIFKTTIFVDLTGLASTTTAADIIGTAGVCHLGQITAAKNGTLIYGQITCLETPAGGDLDIDFWSATEATGAYDDLVTDLTEVIMRANAGNWAAGAATQVALTNVPAADKYMYMAVGSAGGAPGTYTAGQFLIELYGV